MKRHRKIQATIAKKLGKKPYFHLNRPSMAPRKFTIANTIVLTRVTFVMSVWSPNTDKRREPKNAKGGQKNQANKIASKQANKQMQDRNSTRTDKLNFSAVSKCFLSRSSMSDFNASGFQWTSNWSVSSLFSPLARCRRAWSLSTKTSGMPVFFICHG